MQTRRLGVEKLYASRGAIDGVMKRLNVPMSIRIARSIKRASRTAFWLSTVLFLVTLSQIDWLTLALAVTVVLALFIYLSALEIGQMLAGREFAAVLAADPGTNRPIILFLRSFGIAQSSLGSRFITELGYILHLSLIVLSRDTSAGDVRHRRYEVEENLDNAIGLNAM
jgi:hypothetical protein